MNTYWEKTRKGKTVDVYTLAGSVMGTFSFQNKQNLNSKQYKFKLTQSERCGALNVYLITAILTNIRSLAMMLYNDLTQSTSTMFFT